jgi:UDP-N-acetyl-D-galactosamine dehydrogenase
VADIVGELKSFGVKVQVHDPMALPEEAAREYGIDLVAADALRPADAVILAVAHDVFVRNGWPLVTGLLKKGTGVVLDVKGRLDRAERPAGIELWRL